MSFLITKRIIPELIRYKDRVSICDTRHSKKLYVDCNYSIAKLTSVDVKWEFILKDFHPVDRSPQNI